MDRKLKILYCSPEVTPFSKTGGLADVSGSLPMALYEMGCDVRVITPKYSGIDNSHGKLKKITTSLRFHIGKRDEEAGLYEGKLPDSNIHIYFVSNEKYFYRKGLYQEDGKDYEDNLERFSFFSMAVLQLLKGINWQPDIIHCNDWQTSFIPVYLNTLVKKDKPLADFYKNSRTIFTIHNLGYQGLFDKENFPVTGLGPEVYNIKGLEFYGKINLLKGGIIFSDIITTVSPTYSKEMQVKELGHGLDGVLRDKKDDLYGILNGVDDNNEWDPSKDKNLAARYSIKSLSKKKDCKKDLQKLCSLKTEDLPLIGMVSRLDNQKGFDILLEIMDELMQLDIQMVILGTGKPEYADKLKRFATRYPAKMSVNLFFDDALAHKIEAGADIFLLPSKYEPCGLSQLYSFRYGTVPVAHKTGGLADTITDYIPSNVENNTATGFLFTQYKGEALLKTILLALNVYKDKKEWKRLMITGMKSDFSWKRSANEYVKLYNKILVNRKIVRQDA